MRNCYWSSLALALWLLPLGAVSADEAALRKALIFHASFDGSADAGFALGDRRIYTATSYKNREDAKAGLHNPDVRIAPGAGRFGDALEFRRKNTKAIYFLAERNVYYWNERWHGTVSFWLSLDPDKDLEPGFSDPIQITDKAYNDAALWVDFTRDDHPRQFRLGVFGDLRNWNPKRLPDDKNPDFLKRLIVVKKPPFARGKWTHVVITHSGLGSGAGGYASLYLDGRLEGTTDIIHESFHWDVKQAAIRVGVNYVGLFDDLAIFSRPLEAQEVRTLYQLARGVKGLR